MLRPIPSAPRRILIVRLGAIGDVARVLPMLAGLRRRFPAAEIDWVVQSKAADLLRGHPEIARLWVVPFGSWREALSREAWRLRRRMRARDYDLVLDFQGMIKGTIWALAAGGPAVRVGWGPGHSQNLAWLWYHGLRTPPGPRVNRHLRHRSLVDWLGAPDVPATTLPFGDSSARVERFLAELGGRPHPWILAWPGSSQSGSHKRWDPDRLREAVSAIAERTGGSLLVGWGPAEEEEARALAAAIPGARMIPPTTIPELALLLGRVDLYVGMDTGPMHVAALLGTPTVGVFGRSDPAIHAPAPHLPARVVAGPDAREWKTRHRRGLPPFEDPDPREVVTAALDLLAAGGRLALDRGPLRGHRR
jgi:heptosyltransferase-1